MLLGFAFRMLEESIMRNSFCIDFFQVFVGNSTLQGSNLFLVFNEEEEVSHAQEVPNLLPKSKKKFANLFFFFLIEKQVCCWELLQFVLRSRSCS